MGFFGVDLFFCLSGFILGYIYLESYSTSPSSPIKISKNFFIKRFARLFPVYLLTTLIAYLFILIATLRGHEFAHLPNDLLDFSTVAKNLIAVQAWDNSPSLNYPAWSVSAEFFAYLIFPILTLIFVKMRHKAKLGACFVLSITFLVHAYSVNYPSFGNPNLIRVSTEFSMGLAAYVLIRDLNFQKRFILFARAALTILLLTTIFLVESQSIKNVLVPEILLLIICVNYYHNIPSKGLSRKWLVKLGLWSYSIYLTHGLVGYAVSGLGLPIKFQNTYLNLLELFILLTVVILSGALMTSLIENPSRKSLLRKIGRATIREMQP